MDEMISWDAINVYKAQVMRNIEYFVALRGAQLARREAGDENWEKTFMAKDTYDIMRISFRGFFAYDWYLIDYATTMPSERLPPDFKRQFALTRAFRGVVFFRTSHEV